MSPFDNPAYLSDPAHVRAQYASEVNLAARSSLYGETTGPLAGDVALAALAEVRQGSVLEVGCGTGWFARRVRDELGAEVVAVDQSERMVELAGERGIEARVADVQALPFPSGSFDRDAVVRYLGSADEIRHLAANVPESFEPFDARRADVVFVADT